MGRSRAFDPLAQALRTARWLGPHSRIAMHVLHDLHFAVRALRRAPGLLAVGVLSLGVGIAAVTTLWTGTETLLFRPLPYDPHDELVFVGTAEGGRGGPSTPTSAADFLELREAAATVRLAAYQSLGASLGGDPPEWVAARRVSGDFFDVLGVGAARGRVLTRADEEPDAADAAVLGHGLWQRRFGADPSIVGRTLRVEGATVTVVGVLPEGFTFGFDSPELWLALRLRADADRTARTVSVIGRTERGIETTRGELGRLAAGLAEAHPATNRERTFRANGVREEWFGGDTFRQGAIASMAAALLVLLVACVNVANLLLAKGAARFDEMSIRRALGADRPRLLGQLLTEAVLLAAFGGILGLLLSFAGLRGLLHLVPAGMPRVEELAIDGRALAFGMSAAFGSALVFGLVPALRTVRAAPGRAGGGRSRAGSAGSGRLRELLVGAEVALAAVLLATTALVLRSVVALYDVDTGFRTEGVVTFTVSLPEARYPDGDARRQAAHRLEEALAATAGVGMVGLGVGVPARSWRTVRYRLPEQAAAPEQAVFARYATPGYMAALGLTEIRGRGLGRDDDVAAPRIALVNERFAAAHWPDADPVGRILLLGEQAVEIVGVVPDAHEYGPTLPPRPALYLPLAQWPASRLDVVLDGGDVGALLDGARAAVAQVDPELAIHGAGPLDDVIMGPAEQFTSLATLLAVMAGAALLLAVAGVYGSMAYSVARRVPEIGIRMAVGADGAAVRRMVLQGALRVSGAGLAIGMLLALGAARGIGAFLFGVSPTDPVAFGAVPLLLLAVSLAAAWLPALRASRVDPLTALRRE